MDSSLKQKWVRALRSGKYKQASGQLKTEDGFCCLGVLCDVYDPSNWIVADDLDLGEDNQEWHYKISMRGGYTSIMKDVLPEEIADAAGLSRQNPEVPYGIDGGMSSLAVINDSGASFAQIADLIETHL
jgi:hypothetical protein